MSKVSAERISAPRTSTEKEAKALAAELVSLLGKKDPWHQDVVFARENLRRHCLAIVFQAPTPSNAANPAIRARKRLAGLNVIFFNTSYNVIRHYRQRLSAMDTALSGKNGDKGGSKRSSKAAAGGVTTGQRRKLLHSFRDFLIVEETFWRDLLIRIVGVFDVEEARASLRLLQIGIGDWEPDPALAEDKQSHDSAILLCHRTLICFGDLARYRELYSDKASSTPKHKQGTLPGAQDEHAKKTFARAYEAYHQARLLIPDDGNPSNQLAVLAGYQADQLSCIYHYYRALCVRKPFATATENLSATMSKILSQWEAEESVKRDKRRLGSKTANYADLDEDEAEKLRKRDASEVLDQFKQTFIVLHAVLFKGTSVDKLPPLFMSVNKHLSFAVHNRILPSDVVVKTVVTALGSWWYARMYRQTTKPGDQSAARASSSSLEASALMHALAVVSELMNVGTGELRATNRTQILQQVAQATKAEQSMILAQNVSAVLRRTLPALRIASMWLLSNGAYLSRYDTSMTQFKPDDPNIPQGVCIAARNFWTTYTIFINALQFAFPASILPATSGDIMLEEDVDMLGFAPLRRRMTETSAGKTGQGLSGALATSAAAGSALHPNEEQVLRLADLLADANLLALSETCPVVLERGQYVLRKKQLNPASQPWRPVNQPSQDVEVSPPVNDVTLSGYYDDLGLPAGVDEMGDSDDDYEITEDDVLDLAMRVATGAKDASPVLDGGMSDNEDDDDEVLWQPQMGTVGDQQPSPSGDQALSRKPLGTHAGGMSPVGTPASRTASDLLLQVLQGSAMDMSNAHSRLGDSFFDEQDHSLGPASAFSGFSEQAHGLVTRSIWSSGTGSIPPLTSQTSIPPRPASNQPNRLVTQTASAEALFNSMPNQNQHNTGSNRSSPNMPGAATMDPLKRNGFAPANGPAAPFRAQQDIWNAGSLRGVPVQEARLQQDVVRPPTQQMTRQHG